MSGGECMAFKMTLQMIAKNKHTTEHVTECHDGTSRTSAAYPSARLSSSAQSLRALPQHMPDTWGVQQQLPKTACLIGQCNICGLGHARRAS